MKKLILAMLLFASCSQEHEVTDGVVVGKSHRPAHTRIWYNPALKMPQPRHVPDEYVIYFADSVRIQWMCVDENTYRTTQKGDRVQRTKN